VGATFLSLAAPSTGEADRSARAALERAEAQLRAGEAEAGRRELRRAAEAAEETGVPALAASIWNDLGTLEAGEERYAEAVGSFSRALAQAEKAGDRALAARALANRARARLDGNETDGVAADLDAAMGLIAPLPALSDKAFVLISLARSYDRLRGMRPDQAEALLLRAHGALIEARRIADELGDARGGAFAVGYLAALYGANGRNEDALELARRALARADAPDARDTQYLWHAQIGRLRRAQGDLAASIAAYRTAVESLEELRPAAADLYGPLGHSFRRERNRIHLELVDVLLEGAADADGDVELQLGEAQRVLERRKADELRNYFQDDCVDAYRAKRADPAVVSASARVIYPVLLPDRTAILVSGPQSIRQYRSPATTAEIVEATRLMRAQITNRASFSYLKSAQRLHAWLIEPIRDELEAAGVETLVFVPDGVLRTIPMAALHDGERYLVERFAVAVTPGLELADPRPLDRREMRVFLGGVSEAVQGFPPLPRVRSELEAIHELYKSEVRLDGAFTVPRIERDLAAEPFSVVHLASHAEFSGRNADTFLLTFDGRLSLDELTDQVGRFRFRDQPLELLTLSACETAKGDERAALGLAGLAVKAGARSALATLWQVNDEAAAQLVIAVYRHLRDPKISRAQALRRAQLTLIRDRRYRHPAYWSAFVLIGNWL
jgi:CHAT domain-containing protein